jgi:anti-sigma regulatory factor (Ser/Thr protein kinase)
LVIGDVAGHGLRAATIMGQLRMALRAYAVEDSSPARVLDRLHQLVRSLGLPDMATVLYLVFDPETGVATFANGGHPPPLLISPTGAATYLEQESSPPLGAMSQAHHVETGTRLPPGSTLLLFTDGLVERRSHSLREGLERLRVEAESADGDLEAMSDHLLTALLETEVGDDVALLAVRPLSLADRSLHFRVPAEPRSLAPLRHVVRRWLKEMEAGPRESYEILVACGEACANAVQHPYGTRNGYLEVDLSVLDGSVLVTVRDSGTWRSSPSSGGGHGLVLIRGFMDTVDVDSRNGGTEVRMRRQIRRESSNGSARPR